MSVSIDSHQHFWRYQREEYPWMSENMDAIRRDFLPEHLHKEMRAAGVEATVTVQARQTLQETSWLLDLAGRHEWIRGVVGWIPLVEGSVEKHLEEYADHPKLKGVRHVLHDEADDFYMLRDHFNAGVRLLKNYDLVYDVLIFERHLPQTIQFVDRHPAQVFVVDHIAKPRISDLIFSPWRENLGELARRENVYCKLSGMITEADWVTWGDKDLKPYFEITLSAFGPKRLMFGSDWPVMLLADEYKGWVDTVQDFTSKLSDPEREWILGRTAVEAYHL